MFTRTEGSLKNKRVGVWLVVLLVGAAVLSGCGGKKVNLETPDDPDKVTPPATPGSLESLVGTSWRFDKLDMIVRFGQPPRAQLANPKDPSQTGPANWSYRDNGVISISFLGTRKAGTWDGNTVVLSGDTGTKLAGEAPIVSSPTPSVIPGK